MQSNKFLLKYVLLISCFIVISKVSSQNNDCRCCTPAAAMRRILLKHRFWVNPVRVFT